MKQYLLSDFGALGDGIFDCSEAFAKAFATLCEGGSLTVGSGVWKTGPLAITGHDITLHLDKGATIQFIPEADLYLPVYSRWEGVNCYCMHPCLFVNETQRVTIEGEGTLDGNGKYWWDLADYKKEFQKEPVTDIEKKLAQLNIGYEEQSSGGGGRQTQFLRPPLVQIKDSRDFVLEGITIQNSPFWTLHPLYSENILLKNLVVKNPKDAPNTDGIDVDSCSQVKIEQCIIDVGDDGIAMKSGSGPDGIAVGLPTTEVVVKNCTVFDAHGGAVIGSETAAGISNISVSDCRFDGTDRGIRIKTRRGRGGVITNLHFSRITMVNNLCPLTVNMYYRCGSPYCDLFSLEKQIVDATTPSISNLTIEDCTAADCKASAAFIVGLPESPVTGIFMKNCNFSIDALDQSSPEESEMYYGLPLPSGKGMRLRNAQITLDQVTITGVEEPFIQEENVELSIL
ncbi:glycoside hydrolase family 28 protein [uncultured Sphaerochaeta sp.]|uniref:glycoside hydrolase family 28 protein n=1 Tax=uncultured Sphaerochaeta sp. TaxID=886478 RepID=UPI002A0A8D5B|nr:glycoside hydrolase family 28 protein [uncultured Sphaerochaeta sp.]